MSEAVKDVVFFIQLLQLMQIAVQLPMKVRVDNIAAIFTTMNTTATGCTKHINIQTKFVKEYQEDRRLVIVFVKSEVTYADTPTKNITNDLHEKHSSF